MLVIDDNEAEAEVYKHDLTKHNTVRYLVKVSFPNVGLYISGVTVQISPLHPEEGLWVQLPATRSGTRWYKPFETSKDSPFFKLVEAAALKAVDVYTADPTNDIPSDDVMNDPVAFDKYMSEGLDKVMNE
ncbi:MAG TPA: hypothetical protein VMR18_00515 [Candidatus Saccharimonadales bacterium]|nr:hypothetical protein [Candidatus Saccharimonadales bacterium]